jgi:hypothetical protein
LALKTALGLVWADPKRIEQSVSKASNRSIAVDPKTQMKNAMKDRNY